MLKWMGALLLIAAGALAGFAESHKLGEHVRFLEGFLRFLTEAEAEIRFSGDGVAQIVKRHGGGLRFLRACAARMEHGDPFDEAWESAVKRETGGNGLYGEEIGMLLDFGRGFGASDVAGQLSHCALYQELFRTRLQLARGEKERRARLVQMLGVFAGAGAALLLC